MKKDIKEQLEKLQYYGEFYAKSDIDDKIKLEELDKSGEISEFGRNFSPQVDHKYTMVISDRRSYLLGNGRGGKDFTNFLTTLEKLDNEKYLGLRESLETDPARYHIYTHRGDLLEAFDGIYDEELQSIGNNFGEVYKDVNEAIKRGEVDLTDYPNLERAFSDYELKLLDKEIWERDNNYVKFYMDNAYEYLNEKNVLLEEAKMLDVEKHKNVGADMKTVNDGSLLDGLSENVSIPEFEKVARGLDKEAVDERKLYEIQDKIIENIKNNDNYKEYSCYKAEDIYSAVGLEDETGEVVVPKYSVVLTSQERPDLLGVSEYPDVNIAPVLNDNGEINLDLKFFEGKLQEFRLNNLFKDIETDDIYENTEDFASFKSVESKANVKLKNGFVFEHESRISSMQHIYDDYNRSGNGINDTVQEISIMDDGRISVKLNIDELSTKDFLKEPLDTFNEYSKSKKYNDILKEGRDSYLDVKDMLIEEGLIDKNRYDELLKEKAEFDKNEEIARENIEKLMEDEAKEEYKLNEETLKRLDDNNFKRSFNELTGEYTLYSTIPDKNGNEVELINYYDYDDSPAIIRKYDVNIVTNGGLPGYRLKLPLLIDKNNDISLIDKLETGLAPMDKELWLMKKKIVSEKISKESQVVLDEPFVQEKFNECNIEYEYNRTTDNYDLYSCKLDYKDEKYKIISCDKKGKVDGYDLYLQDEDSEFYNYVEDLQTIKSDSKYKNFNFEFNVERAAKVRELTKPSNAVVEDEDANEDDAELSIKQACFENIIRKMTEQNNGMER